MDDRILIADGDGSGGDGLAEPLRLAGYQVVRVASGREALREASALRPKLLVLGWQQPDLGGLEVLRRLRGDPLTARMPVLMTAAHTEEVDRVAAFLAGADDFVTPPCSPRETVLRIQAILRRIAGAGRDEREGAVRVGRLRVDRDAHRVEVGGREVPLTALEFRLLVTLMDRRDRVQGREVLLQDAWAMTADVTTRTVDTHIRRLRQKLGEAGALVETVRGVGYRFAGPLPEEG